MDILVSTLKEELQTARRLEKKYSGKIKNLLKGSFILRQIGNKRYGYLTRRQGNRIVQEYLGSLNDEKISDYQNRIKQRKEYRKKLKNVREQIRVLRRALRGKAT